MKKNITGSIEHRGKGSWRVGFQIPNVDGSYTWVRRTIHVDPSLSEAKQRKAAEAELIRLRAERDEPIAEKHALTFSEFAELWMEQYALPNLSPVTAKTYRHFLDARVLPELGSIPMQDITSIRLTRFLNDLRTAPRKTTRKQDAELAHGKRHASDAAKLATADALSKPLSDRTVQHYHDTLTNIFRTALSWKVITEDPMASVPRPKAKKSKANFLTEERAAELIRLIAEEPDISYRVAVMLALTCGLRLGEVVGLRWRDVDLDAGTIDITHATKYAPTTGQYTADPKTDAGARMIALPAVMLDLLREARAEYEFCAANILHWTGEDWIVRTVYGAQLNKDTPSKWFRRFADRNGFEGIRFHDLRHTHATILLANNIDAVAVAHRLGHASADTTLRVYAHALRRRDTDAANAIDSVFNPTKSNDHSEI